MLASCRRGGSGSSCASRMITWNTLSPDTGGWPVSRKYSVAPRPYTSVRRSTRLSDPLACSGAMNSGEPSTEPVTVVPSVSVSRARPKSVTKGCQPPSAPGSSMMLAGLTSRWTIPSRWAAWIASATCASRATFWSRVSRGLAFSSDSPST